LKKTKLKDLRVGTVVNIQGTSDHYWNIEAQKHAGLELWYLHDIDKVELRFRGVIKWIPMGNVADMQPILEEVKPEITSKRASA
jgi:hypothetical protein